MRRSCLSPLHMNEKSPEFPLQSKEIRAIFHITIYRVRDVKSLNRIDTENDFAVPFFLWRKNDETGINALLV